jgi:hypothetical protein
LALSSLLLRLRYIISYPFPITLQLNSFPQQKFGKIKKRDADIFNGAAKGTTQTKAPSNPSPAKRGRPKAVAADANNDEEDDEEATSVMKSRKKLKKEEPKDSPHEMYVPHFSRRSAYLCHV